MTFQITDVNEEDPNLKFMRALEAMMKQGQYPLQDY